MPYILIHPLPPPKRNPYKPELPTFTTSSRPIAHFFHSHGWRVRHMYVDLSDSPSARARLSPTWSRSSPTASSRSNNSAASNSCIDAGQLSIREPPPDHEQPNCCCSSAGSSIRSCGPILELHCYLIPLCPVMFHGPPATAQQLRYLRYYARPHTNFEDDDGGVDLHLPNRAGLALQKATDETLWQQSRRAERRRVRNGSEDAQRTVPDEAWTRETVTVRTRDVRSAGFVRTGSGPGTAEERVGVLKMGRLATVLPERRRIKESVVQSVKEGVERPRLVSAEQDEEVDEELGQQWETCERVLLASEGLEWAEDEKTLRQTRNV